MHNPQKGYHETRIAAYSENSSLVGRGAVDDGVGVRWLRDAYTTWLELLSLLLNKESSPTQSDRCDTGGNGKLHVLLSREGRCVSSEYWTLTNSSRFRAVGLGDDKTDVAVYCKHNRIIVNVVHMVVQNSIFKS